MACSIHRSALGTWTAAPTFPGLQTNPMCGSSAPSLPAAAEAGERPLRWSPLGFPPEDTGYNCTYSLVIFPSVILGAKSS
jgi:hypothetical protein